MSRKPSQLPSLPHRGHCILSPCCPTLFSSERPRSSRAGLGRASATLVPGSPCCHLGVPAWPERIGKAPPVDQTPAPTLVPTSSTRNPCILPSPSRASIGAPDVSDVELAMPTLASSTKLVVTIQLRPYWPCPYQPHPTWPPPPGPLRATTMLMRPSMKSSLTPLL